MSVIGYIAAHLAIASPVLAFWLWERWKARRDK
jgi:hypothetical protein